MGPLLMVRPRVLGSDMAAVDDKPRTLPVNFGESVMEKDEFDMQLPAGYVVDEMPEPVKMDVGFASYESKRRWTTTCSTIRVRIQCVPSRCRRTSTAT